MSEIYLDNNATTRIDPQVAEAMHEVAMLRLANPSSQHKSGRKARQILETAREGLAGHLGCRTTGMATDQVIFTSGGTEANNLAILGIKNPRISGKSDKLSSNESQSVRDGLTVVSKIEHPSVLAAAESLHRQQGLQVRYCEVNSNGLFDLDAFQELIDRHDLAVAREDRSNQISLVSLMLANNETGVLQPIQSVVELCKPRSILVHTDAVQVLGKVPLNFQCLGVDAMTVTAHKVHGPTGIGALVMRAGLEVEAQLFGGFQQLGIRPGTECVSLAVGFEKAVSLATGAVSDRSAHMRKLRETFECRLQKNSSISHVIGSEVERLPHTSSVAFRGYDRQALQMSLDFAGIACSTGSACASGSGQPSHVLKAMGLDESTVQGAIRFSLSHETTLEEIERAATIINSVVETLAAKQNKLKFGSS